MLPTIEMIQTLLRTKSHLTDRIDLADVDAMSQGPGALSYKELFRSATTVWTLYAVWVDEWRMVLAACTTGDYSKVQPVAPEPKRLMLQLVGLMSSKAAHREGELQGATSGTSMSTAFVTKAVDNMLAAANDET